MQEIILVLAIPFLGTVTGAASVYLLRSGMPDRMQKALLGFASGVMIAASVWSLLIPAIDMSTAEGLRRVLPAVAGFLCGMAFLFMLDKVTPHQHVVGGEVEGPASHLSRTSKLALAVTLHNIPEGMAVGVTLAGVLEHDAGMSMAAAMALAVGIAIQNFPEGAIVSLPLHGAGNTRHRAFGIGVLSGAVEPAAAILTILLATYITPALPFLLAFAAGSMLFVVVEELIPETQTGSHSNLGTTGFALGFALMMTLDVVLG